MGHSPVPEICSRPLPAGGLTNLPPDLHPVLGRVLAARQVTRDQLQPGLARLLPVGELPGVGAAADRLVQARERGEQVLIVGDFDADGATATALAMTCLRAFDFARPDFLVPDRFTLGYGLSPGIAELAATRQPSLLLTVDNGITSHEGVRRAQALGMQVLISDHHLPGKDLPSTDWIVNPNLPGASFASPALCGVGVAFYLMAATGKGLVDRGLVSAARARDAVTDCLDLVALGTVADLVPLDFNNRILVTEGLRRMRAGRSRPGIDALFKIGARDTARACTSDLGFALAPRLNAAGRLADMTRGIECLLAPTEAVARPLAAELDRLNKDRRALQARMQAEAEELLALLPTGRLGAGLCLYDARWHSGIVGLVANRMKELTGQPAIAFAPGTERGMLRGSARSVEGVHIRDLIEAAVTAVPGLRVRYGGHAMAAGLSLAEEDLPAFHAALAEALARQVRPAPGVLWTDGELAPADLHLGLAAALAAAGPWGQGFPEPLFANVLTVREQRVIGTQHLRLGVQHPAGGPVLEAVAFRRPPLAAAKNVPVRLVYRLEVNHYRGQDKVQLVVEHLESV